MTTKEFKKGLNLHFRNMGPKIINVLERLTGAEVETEEANRAFVRGVVEIMAAVPRERKAVPGFMRDVVGDIVREGESVEGLASMTSRGFQAINRVLGRDVEYGMYRLLGKEVASGDEG